MRGGAARVRGSGRPVLSGEDAAAERRVADDAEAEGLGGWDGLALGAAGEQGVLHLDGGHAGAAVLGEEVGCAHGGPGRVVGDAHVAGASRVDGGAQSVDRLLQRRARVGHLDEPKIEVVGAEPREGVVEDVEEGAAGGVGGGGARSRAPGAHTGLGDEDDVAAVDVLSEQAADDLLGGALAVGGGRVEEGSAGVEEDVELVAGLELVGVAAPGHRAQSHRGHRESRATQSALLHAANRRRAGPRGADGAPGPGQAGV